MPVSTKELSQNLPLEIINYASFTERKCLPTRREQIPTYVFWDATILPHQAHAISCAIKDFFTQTGLKQDGHMLLYPGYWHSQEQINQKGEIAAFESVDWLIRSSFFPNSKCLDVTKVVDSYMSLDPRQQPSKDRPHWNVLFTNYALGYKVEGSKTIDYLFGNSVPDLGTIISFNGIDYVFNEKSKLGNNYQNLVSTIVAHELGHTIFDIPSSRRGQIYLDSRFGGDHCLNQGCSMQQGFDVETFLRITNDRLKTKRGSLFCRECFLDIKDNFKS